MKIENCNSVLVNAGSLSCGQPFMYNNEVYIKTTLLEHGGVWVCVNLKDGAILKLQADNGVFEINAKVVIE